MNFKKTVAIAAAAGALAAVSVPAMALENEFHGLFNFNTTFSNFQAGGSGDFTPVGWQKNRQMNNYIEQRGRIQYIAKASDDLKFVTQFELDTRFGGITDNKYTSSNDSGKLDADGISLETKHVYLDFNASKEFNAKLGVQPYKDTIKGVFIDADLPAIMTTTKMGAYTLGVGFSRFSENYQNAAGTTARLGDGAKDLFILDNTFAINKDTKAALSYYFLADYTASTTGGAATLLDTHNAAQDIMLSTLALRGETKLGALNLSGFAAMQGGSQKAIVGTPATGSRYFHGYALNAAAKMAVGPGTAKTAFLFTSGNNSRNAGSYKGWVTSSVDSYNEGGMMILARNTANSPTSTDAFIRRNVTNIALLTMGYDAKLTDKLFANGNLGFAWAPSSVDAPLFNPTGALVNTNTTGRNGGDFMGTEINLETGYKLYSNLTLKAQAAYMMLGAYYKNTAVTGTGSSATPENPYSARLHAQFSF